MRDVPTVAIETIISSLAECTLRQYNTTYRLWWSYCSKEGIPLYNATIQNVISFLHTITQEHNYKYGSVNSHRSALNLILAKEIASDPILKRYMKGISRMRPPRPRYTSTWDPQILLSHLEQIEVDSNLRLLSQKLVTLLALITGGRIQTISLIRLSNIIEDEQEIQIVITDPIKTTGLNTEQPTLHIPFFRQRPKLCVATALQSYIAMTKKLRKPEQDLVFLTHKKPHRTANKQTLSKWVKQMMSSADLDTTIFRPHSTRHSSTSAALRRGVPLETICRTAGWSPRTATFARFYNRPLTDQTAFARAVFGIPEIIH